MTVEIPRTIRWHGDAVRIIDQTLLPTEYREIDLVGLDEVVEAIKMLRVRGAPAIGIAGAMGLVASLKGSLELRPEDFRKKMRDHASAIVAARPTGANLEWAVNRVVEAAGTLLPALREALEEADPGDCEVELREDDAVPPGFRVRRADDRVVVDATLTAQLAARRRRLESEALQLLDAEEDT